ncbi:Ycf66 family protein, partial [Prochlorothrix hollandica]|uniref:Ycf66 family protein n=1 Tax=Prochlorothrix hollandica TaxID=1223 RepID=UPI0033424BE1
MFPDFFSLPLLPVHLQELPLLLSHGLAIAVGLASGGLYLMVFLVPVLARSGDLPWSGLGLFYSLVLWFGGGQFQGVALLGQGVSVVLLLGTGNQILRFRWADLTENQKASIPLVRRVRRWQRARATAAAARVAARVAAVGVKESDSPVTTPVTTSVTTPATLATSTPGAIAPTPIDRVQAKPGEAITAEPPALKDGAVPGLPPANATATAETAEVIDAAVIGAAVIGAAEIGAAEIGSAK